MTLVFVALASVRRHIPRATRYVVVPVSPEPASR
jgi:hypothetical protein